MKSENTKSEITPKKYRLLSLVCAAEKMGIGNSTFEMEVIGGGDITLKKGDVIKLLECSCDNIQVLSSKWGERFNGEFGRQYRPQLLTCTLYTSNPLSFLPDAILDSGKNLWASIVESPVFPEKKKYADISQFFDQEGPKDIELFVSKNLDISQKVYAILKGKKWTIKDLAQATGKSEKKISKWLTGCHDLTLRDITRMEAALGRDIMTIIG